MTFRLPTTPGESSILWSHDDDGVPERLLVECHAGPTWTLAAEIEDCDEWGPAGICLDGYRDSWTSLAMALRTHTTNVLGFMGALVKGSARVPTGPKPNKFARLTGGGRWWAAWAYEGTNSNGLPMLSIEFSRPLNADELTCAIRQMCKAFDAWDAEVGS